MIHRPCALGAALVALAVASPLGAQSKTWPQPYLIEDVRLSDAEDAKAVSLLLRNGRIAQVMDDPRPELTGVWRIDGEGRLVTPAFIDAFSQASLETPEPEPTRDAPVDVRGDVRVDMREANRKGIQAALDVTSVLTRDDQETEKHREAGFGAVLHAPTGQLLGGRSALVTTHDAPLRDAVHRDGVFQHADWAASGSGYPTTPMGFMAHLRQFFLDVRYLNLRRSRYDQGKPDPRPPFDDDLTAAAPVEAGEQRLVCEADRLRDMERWFALGAEFDLALGLAGGREAWRVVEELAEGEVPVLLTLNWGEEVDDPHEEEEEEEEEEAEGSDEEAASDDEEAAEEPEDESAEETDEVVYEYEEPLGVREERRRRWEEGRDCALRLADAGVAFAFGTADEKPADLLDKVRELVEVGLDRDVAMTALTAGAAEILGVGDRLGRIAPGYDATLAIWTKHPLEEKAKLAWLLVDGYPYEFDLEDRGAPDEGVDASGEWELKLLDDEMSPNTFTVTLEMEEDGAVTGRVVAVDDEEDDGMEVEGQVSGSELSLEGSTDMDGLAVEVKIEVELDDDEFEGTVTLRSEHFDMESRATGTRTSEPEEN